MKKTFIALLLALLLVPGLVFAEGSKEAAVEETTVKLNPVGTYPIVNEPVTINVMVAQPQCVEDFNTNDFTMFMEELTGVHVNYIQVPEMAAKEKLNLTLAGGDWPDAFLGFGLDADLEALYGTEEGLILPLNKYYSDEYMPNLMAALDDFPGSKGFMTNIDGNIYSFPRLEGCFHCSNMFKLFGNKDFMDALGLDWPETTDELYDVLKAIKTQDPNGNGKADEIPLTGAIIGWGTSIESYLLNAFIYTDLDYNVNKPAEEGVGYWVDNGTVKTIVDTDEYREGLKYLNKLYKEGLIYNGTFTQDADQLTQLIESGDDPVVGFVTGGWRGCFSSVDSPRFRAFRAVAPVAGPEGVREARNALQTPQSGSLFLSSETPYAEVICRYYDYMYSLEGTLRERNGEPGVGWDWADEDGLGLDGKPAIWKQLIPWNDKDPQNVTYIDMQVGSESYAMKDGLQKDPITPDDPEYYGIGFNEKALRDETANLYKPYAHPEKQVPDLKFTTEENEKYATAKVEYAKYVRSEGVKFIVGTLDPNSDKDWNKYLKDLDGKLQKNELLALTQTAYDRQYK